MTNPKLHIDDLRTYINFARLLVERDRRIYRDNFMPALEIKGLSASVAAARKHISDARTSLSAMHEAGASLKKTTEEVTVALKSAEADIRFEVEQLGNGGPTSEKSVETSEKPAVPPQVPSFR